MYVGMLALLPGLFVLNFFRDPPRRITTEPGEVVSNSESFAELFFGNSPSLGLPAVCAERASLEKISNAIQADPALELTVDLESCELRYGGESIPVTIPESARDALVTGQWDFLAQLMENQSGIQAQKEALPYLNGFASP